MYLPSTSQPGRLHNMPAPESKPARLFHEYSEDDLRHAMMGRQPETPPKPKMKTERPRRTSDRRAKMVEYLTGKWAGFDEIEDAVCLSKSRVRSLCSELVQAGVLEKKRGPRKGSVPAKVLFRRKEGGE